eukprot:GHVP01037778.1.p1 GENE.GHVP01037778.1~~GHVP01037778.1.p1  ORF type:complete len:130 (+),score=15.50 GHVP01037778.1:73-462(+)
MINCCRVDEIACLSFPSKADTNESETSFLFAQMRIGKVVMVTFQGTTVPKISELPFTYQKVCAMGCSQQLSSIHHGVKFSGRIFVATLDAEEGLLQICHVCGTGITKSPSYVAYCVILTGLKFMINNAF